MIQFILNQALIQLDTIAVDRTLLDYLRLDKNLTGSKEGCASGDCGACTVVVASVNKKDNKLDYQSLNSCICLLGSLHGKQVVTVDGLKDSDDSNLHPVQQAMVDAHASQCGFCTPGFVMSLFAMTKNKCSPDRELVAEHIDGNLCRCTGYRPIVDAALAVLRQPFSDVYDRSQEQTLKRLQALPSAQQSGFFMPETVDELASLVMKYPDAKLLAGGTDLVIDITQGLQGLDEIIYLGNVNELRQIEHGEQHITIGAAVTYQEGEKVLVSAYPDLMTHFQRLGSTQIRNVGTIGGNITNASPIGDMPPVLVALGCTLVLQRGKVQREVAIEDFYTGYKQTVLQAGEFLREILIPYNQPSHHFKTYKISKRYADDISAICAAIYCHVDNGIIVNARVAMGGMAATVKRASHCEKSLANKPLSQATLHDAKKAVLKDFEPLDDVRASKEYRLLMAQNVLERYFNDVARSDIENSSEAADVQT